MVGRGGGVVIVLRIFWNGISFWVEAVLHCP